MGEELSPTTDQVLKGAQGLDLFIRTWTGVLEIHEQAISAVSLLSAELVDAHRTGRNNIFTVKLCFVGLTILRKFHPGFSVPDEGSGKADGYDFVQTSG